MNVFIALLISIILAGCASTKGNTLEVTNQVSYVSIPADKLMTVIVPSPPAKEMYVKLTPIEREKALADYSTLLLIAIGQANGIIEDIRLWNDALLKKNK